MTWAILKMQLWSLWRLTRIELLARFASPLVFVGFALWQESGKWLLFLVIIAASLFSTSWFRIDSKRIGDRFPFRLDYTQPVPAVWLAATPLAWSMVASVLMYSLWAGISWNLLAVRFPLTPVIPFLLLITAVLHFQSWSARGYAKRITLSLIVGGVLLGWASTWPATLSPLLRACMETCLALVVEGNGSVAMLSGALVFGLLTVIGTGKQRV